MAQDNVIYTVSTQLIGEHHEALLLNNGDLEVENWMRNFTDDFTLDHLRLGRALALELIHFLNKPENLAILEQ